MRIKLSIIVKICNENRLKGYLTVIFMLVYTYKNLLDRQNYFGYEANTI